MNSMVRLASLFCLFACVGLLITSSGCSSNPATATVTGKVTANGEPVTSGSLTFSPIGGEEGSKPAIGVVKSDGSYTLSTYAPDDGAVVGSHRVNYISGSNEDVEEGEGYEEEETPAESEGEHDEADVVEGDPYAGLMPKETQVTVEAGGSTINIELVPMTGDPGSDSDSGEA